MADELAWVLRWDGRTGQAEGCIHSSGGHWALLGTERGRGKEAQTKSRAFVQGNLRAASHTKAVSLTAARQGRRPSSFTFPPQGLTAPPPTPVSPDDGRREP